MNLESLRKEIDLIDDQMMDLFVQRMALSQAIGTLKKELQLPIFDASREKSILEKRRNALNNESLWPYYESFLKHLMDISKEHQR